MTEQANKPSPNAVTPADLKRCVAHHDLIRRKADELYNDGTASGRAEALLKSSFANSLRKILIAQGAEGLPGPHVPSE